MHDARSVLLWLLVHARDLAKPAIFVQVVPARSPAQRFRRDRLDRPEVVLRRVGQVNEVERVGLVHTHDPGNQRPEPWRLLRSCLRAQIYTSPCLSRE